MNEQLKTTIEKTKLLFEKFKKHESTNSEIIHLNIGGKRFSTLRTTLTKKIARKLHANNFYKLSLFDGILGGYLVPKYDEQNAIFIDRNSRHFNLILDYLRTVNTENEFEQLSLSVKELRELRDEAVYYNLNGMIDLVDKEIGKYYVTRIFNFGLFLLMIGILFYYQRYEMIFIFIIGVVILQSSIARALSTGIEGLNNDII